MNIKTTLKDAMVPVAIGVAIGAVVTKWVFVNSTFLAFALMFYFRT